MRVLAKDICEEVVLLKAILFSRYSQQRAAVSTPGLIPEPCRASCDSFTSIYISETFSQDFFTSGYFAIIDTLQSFPLNRQTAMRQHMP
jgi:hypothetical protein